MGNNFPLGLVKSLGSAILRTKIIKLSRLAFCSRQLLNYQFALKAEFGLYHIPSLYKEYTSVLGYNILERVSPIFIADLAIFHEK